MTATHLSAGDLARLRQALVHERDALLAAREQRLPTELTGNAGEVEEGDMAEQLIEQDDALRIGAFEETRLDDIDDALAKLERGTYGLSEDSGEPIPLRRLEALPWARRTAEEEERRAAR